MTDEILYVRKKLPVWATTLQSYRWLRHHPRLLALPMAVLFAAEFAEEILSAQVFSDAGSKIAAALLLTVVDGAFCVGLHRTIIIDDLRGGLAFLRWGFELWRYLKTALIATLGVMLVGVAVLAVAGSSVSSPDFQSAKLIVAAGIALIPVFYLAARLILAFPAAALGRDRVFGSSWRAGKGNAFRLLAILILTCLVPTVIDGLLDFATPAAGPLSWLTIFASSAVQVLNTALSTNALSFSYLALVPRHDLTS